MHQIESHDKKWGAVAPTAHHTSGRRLARKTRRKRVSPPTILS